MGNSPSAAPPEVVVHPDDSHLNLAARRVARIQDTLVQLDKAIEATYPAQSGVLEAATSLIGSLPVGLPNTPEDRARLRDALTPPIGTLEGLASLHGEMVVLLARADDIEKAYNGREDAREQLQAAKAEHEKHKGSYQQKKDLMKSAKTAAKGAERQKEKGTLGFDLEHTMHVAKAYTCSGKKEVLEAETGVDKANARFEELTSALVADVAEFEASAAATLSDAAQRLVANELELYTTRVQNLQMANIYNF